MRPVIGVMPLEDRERDSLWMLPGYLDGLEAAGALPVVLPLTLEAEVLEDLLGLCAGLLFTGGQDVEPQIYGQAPISACGEPSPRRDGMERWMLERALERDIPVLGICRGLQLWNAHLGGTLYQDLPSQRPGPVDHCQKPPYDRPVHQVTVAEGTLLGTLISPGEHAVNSYHHQGIRQLAPGLRACAAAEDGLVEGIELPGRRFALAVQWHPEFCHKSDPAAREIFRGFVRACRRP